MEVAGVVGVIGVAGCTNGRWWCAGDAGGFGSVRCGIAATVCEPVRCVTVDGAAQYCLNVLLKRPW